MRRKFEQTELDGNFEKNLNESMEHLKYPIGRFTMSIDDLDDEAMQSCIKRIETFPEILGRIARPLSNAQLDTPYRPDGWTARQVIHHCADSHMNAYLRFKLALTENCPLICAYKEADWAKMSDASELAIEASLLILEGIHFRWAHMLKRMESEQWNRGYFHPEKNRVVILKEALASYAWHCDHHLGHIKLVAGKAE